MIKSSGFKSYRLLWYCIECVYQAHDDTWELLTTNKHMWFCTACGALQGESSNKLTYINYKDEAFIENHTVFIVTKLGIHI